MAYMLLWEIGLDEIMKSCMFWVGVDTNVSTFHTRKTVPLTYLFALWFLPYQYI